MVGAKAAPPPPISDCNQEEDNCSEGDSEGEDHSYLLLGNVVCNFKKNPTITQDLSRRCIAMRGESVSTYPGRPKAEALSNTVNVVERLRDPTDQVPNARHLCDLHMFSSVMSLEL